MFCHIFALKTVFRNNLIEQNVWNAQFVFHASSVSKRRLIYRNAETRTSAWSSARGQYSQGKVPYSIRSFEPIFFLEIGLLPKVTKWIFIFAKWPPADRNLILMWQISTLKVAGSNPVGSRSFFLFSFCFFYLYFVLTSNKQNFSATRNQKNQKKTNIY